MVCDALRLAVITVNHSPSPLLVKHGEGRVPLRLTKLLGNDADVHTAAPLYMAAPPCGLVLVWAEATVATSIQITKTRQIFFICFSFLGSRTFSCPPLPLRDTEFS